MRRRQNQWIANSNPFRGINPDKYPIVRKEFWRNTMKTRWALVGLVLASAVALVLTACDGGSKGANGQIPVTCVSGQCYNYYGYPYQYGANSQIQFTARKMDVNYTSYGYYQLGSVNLSSAGWRALLKEAMGVCDRTDISGGQASCDYWVNGTAEIAFQMDSTTSSGVRLMIKASAQSSYINYYYSVPSLSNFLLGWLTGYMATNPQGYFNPMILNASIWPVNNNQGFEIRSYGPTYSAAWNKLIQFQVATGKVEDASFTYNLYYNGALVASGTMQNCMISGYNYCTFL
jgi:hypothetical protein